MEKNIRKMQEIPETAPEPSPAITPDMIKTALEALERRGVIFYAEGGAYIPTESGWKLLTEIKPVREVILARGHQNVKAMNQKMFVIVKDADIRKDFDAVIAVKADKACGDLSADFRNAVKGAKRLEITIEAEGVIDKVMAYGSPAMMITNFGEIAVRKNDVIDDRTLGIMADKSANELKQELVEKLRNPKTEVKIILEIKP
jgi:hypothetical protein